MATSFYEGFFTDVYISGACGIDSTPSALYKKMIARKRSSGF